MPLKPELLAVEYRYRADAESAAAVACSLEQPRRLHEAAARRWRDLAEAEDRRLESRRLLLATARP